MQMLNARRKGSSRMLDDSYYSEQSSCIEL